MASQSREIYDRKCPVCKQEALVLNTEPNGTDILLYDGTPLSPGRYDVECDLGCGDFVLVVS